MVSSIMESSLIDSANSESVSLDAAYTKAAFILSMKERVS